jgi:dipeptidyl aminopeptidase/acylaminoacyl peptidase
MAATRSAARTHPPLVTLVFIGIVALFGNFFDIDAAAFSLLHPAVRQSSSQSSPQRPSSAPSGTGGQTERVEAGTPDFERMRREQAQTDRTWRQASIGFMRMEKITYRSRVGDLDIPAFIFQPIDTAPPRTQPALVWVHENIRGHLYEHFIPYIRDAVARGYVVIAPEYRGSVGYGKTFYDAIDYGGAEVDDVVTAVSVLRTRYPAVDPGRVGIIGWSHGGLIALLAVFRNPTSFKSAAAIVPVANLIQRFAWKGEEQMHALIDPRNRFGGLPAERRSVYRDRSPLFQVDKLQIPLLVHIAENDEDVNIEEALPLVDALRARKSDLAETNVYAQPPGGHTFDRRVDPRTWQPENTPDQFDSWSRVWKFFAAHLS